MSDRPWCSLCHGGPDDARRTRFPQGNIYLFKAFGPYQSQHIAPLTSP